MTCDGCGRSFPAYYSGWVPDELTSIGTHHFCEVCLREIAVLMDKLSFKEILQCLEEHIYYESIW